MDLKTRIMRWENAIQENPAVLALAIVVVLAVVFIAAMMIDGFLKDRKKNKRKRR